MAEDVVEPVLGIRGIERDVGVLQHAQQPAIISTPRPTHTAAHR